MKMASTQEINENGVYSRTAPYSHLLERANLIVFDLIWFGFHGPSRLFHSSWAEPVDRWGGNETSLRKKKIWSPASRTWLVTHVTRARLEPQRWDDKWLRALKISGLNFSATGAAESICIEFCDCDMETGVRPVLTLYLKNLSVKASMQSFVKNVIDISYWVVLMICGS